MTRWRMEGEMFDLDTTLQSHVVCPMQNADGAADACLALLVRVL